MRTLFCTKNEKGDGFPCKKSCFRFSDACGRYVCWWYVYIACVCPHAMKKLLTCPSRNIFSMVGANAGLVVVVLANSMRTSYCSQVYIWMMAIHYNIHESKNTYGHIRVKKGTFTHLAKLVQNFFHLVVVLLPTWQLYLRCLNL